MGLWLRSGSFSSHSTEALHGAECVRHGSYTGDLHPSKLPATHIFEPFAFPVSDEFSNREVPYFYLETHGEWDKHLLSVHNTILLDSALS